MSFESGYRHFPMGAEGRYDRKISPTYMYGVSWWADTTRYLEGANIVDQLDRNGLSPRWVYLNADNGKLIHDFAPEYWFCPSSAVAQFVKAGDYRVAAPTYSGISGATDHDGFPETRVNRCCRSEGQISGGGVLIPNAVIRLRQITDGLSNTLLVGEQSDFAYTDLGQPMQIGAAFVKGWLAGTVTLGVPPKYTDWMAPSYNLTTVRYRLNEHRYDLPGIYFDSGSNNPLLSPHPQVVNLLCCDGSVRGASELMDVAVLKSFSTRDDSGKFGRRPE
jgi:hypothetical protein